MVEFPDLIHPTTKIGWHLPADVKPGRIHGAWKWLCEALG